MNAREAALLCKFAKAACPQQAIDEATPDAWFALMGDLRFTDAQAALVDIARRQPFVAPSEIIARVRQIRGKRIADFGPIDPPRGLDEGGDWRAWFVATRARIGDGTLTRDQYAAELAASGATGARKPPELEGVFQRVDPR